MKLERRKEYLAAHLKVKQRFGSAVALAALIAEVTGEPRNISIVVDWGRRCFITDKEAVLLASVLAGHDPPVTIEDFYPTTIG